MGLFKTLLGGNDEESTPEHDWEHKRTYDLPGPVCKPEVTVEECSDCGIIKETSRWHEPNPQYFEKDTKEAERLDEPECDRWDCSDSF